VRENHSIRRRIVTNSRPAILLARQIGTPLNQFVTINFSHTDCGEREAAAAFRKLREGYFTPWLRRPPVDYNGPVAAPAFIWVFENPDGHVNVHWMLHIPAGRLAAFRERLPKWLEKATGGVKCATSALDVKPIRNVFGLRLYMLKGMEEKYAHLYGVDHIPQGKVYGKRMGYSKSLGPSACKKGGTNFTARMKAKREAQAQRKGGGFSESAHL
jgi:hypothetical protein